MSGSRSRPAPEPYRNRGAASPTIRTTSPGCTHRASSRIPILRPWASARSGDAWPRLPYWPVVWMR
eukprot:7981165-Prorocentrum_lima.AAC.1